MIKIASKSLQDLEFPTVRKQISELCTTQMGVDKALEIVPYSTYDSTIFGLSQTNEYVSSYMQDSKIPNHSFDAIHKEIKLLGIENAILEIGGFRKISSLSQTANDQIRFFNKFKELYPNLYKTTEEVEYTKVIIERIDEIIDRFGDVKDNASTVLLTTRRAMNLVKGQINSSFTNALSKYSGYGYLDEIKESVVDNIRVLAVSAMHRKKVKGGILGNSKTGSIVYIQPEATLNHTRELNNLEYEEKEEIDRILKELTVFLVPFTELLKEYQELLSEIDVVAAKSKYARLINGILPKISKERQLYLKDAYHPYYTGIT